LSPTRGRGARRHDRLGLEEIEEGGDVVVGQWAGYDHEPLAQEVLPGKRAEGRMEKSVSDGHDSTYVRYIGTQPRPVHRRRAA
jgi:hypothetical protein